MASTLSGRSSHSASRASAKRTRRKVASASSRVSESASSLASALAPAVRVNAVCPGLITTRWFVQGVGQQGYEAGLKSYEARVPLQRACLPEDVAEAIVWLVDGAKTVTGELLMLDSGMNLAGTRPPR